MKPIFIKLGGLFLNICLITTVCSDTDNINETWIGLAGEEEPILICLSIANIMDRINHAIVINN